MIKPGVQSNGISSVVVRRIYVALNLLVPVVDGTEHLLQEPLQVVLGLNRSLGILRVLQPLLQLLLFIQQLAFVFFQLLDALENNHLFTVS
jgi:hypothetical protein